MFLNILTSKKVKSCIGGNHVISKEDKDLLREKKLEKHIVKCANPNCENYLQLIKNYDFENRYFIIDLGKKRIQISQ